MAKQPDPSQRNAEHENPRVRKDEIEEVMDAEVVDMGQEAGPKTSNQSPSPTRIAPYQADEPELTQAQPVEENSDVHDVLADEAPRSSSIIEVSEPAEVVEEGSSDVLANEPAKQGSSVVSSSVLLLDSDAVSSGVVEATPTPAKNASAAPPSDVVMTADEVRAANVPADEDEIVWEEVIAQGEDHSVPDKSDLDAAARDDDAREVEFDEEEAAVAAEPVAARADKGAVDMAAKSLIDETDKIAESIAANSRLKEKKAVEAKHEVKAGGEEDAIFEAEERKESIAETPKEKIRDQGDTEKDLVGAGAGLPPRKFVARQAGKPRNARHLVGGVFLATLFLGGAAAGIWYAKPELLEQAYKSSPSYVAPKKEKAKVDPPAVRARAMMDNKDFDQAVAFLQDADKTPVNLSARAEARWLKYMQQQATANKALEKAAPEVKLALADAKEAGNELLASQITNALDASELRASAKENEQALSALKDRAEKAEAAGKNAEKMASGLKDALAKEKEGTAKLVDAQKETEAKLEAVNKLLVGEKVKDEGAKGLAEVIAARDQLAKERDELAQTIKGAYKELAASGGAAPNDDLRAAIATAVKAARSQGDSPLTVPLSQLANSITGMASSAGSAVAKGLNLSALATERALKELSKRLEKRAPVQQAEAPVANPGLAEQYFSTGLERFWSRRYADAENQFKQAIQSYDQDARFHYYLGLALLSQNGNSKRDAAIGAFEEGARLEAADRPSTGEINASLERIQGPLRAFVNSYRQNATRVAAR